MGRAASWHRSSACGPLGFYFTMEGYLKVHERCQWQLGSDLKMLRTRLCST
jgi:hypothetical protein